jgi:uncharacterized membrane protein YcaP (DUF421 family)
MKPEEIKFDDWLRIVVGEVPFTFFAELFLRAAVVYLILMLSMRLMGKRMSSQLSRNELAVLVSLAAAIGIPLMAPDRGLLPAVVIAIVLVFGERWIAARAAKSEKFESLTQGQITTLIRDGVIDVNALQSVSLSRERLLSQLRSAGITHTGMIRRFYMEANGAFTLVKAAEAKSGLPTLPGWDDALTPCFTYDHQLLACSYCAQTETDLSRREITCIDCGKKDWASPVKKINF